MKKFLDIEIDYRDADFVIIPVPYDHTETLNPGSRFGPEALIEASRGLEYYDFQSGNSITDKIYTLPETELPISPERMLDWVEGTVDKVVQDGKFPVLIGGEHTITLGAVNALKRYYKNLVISVFDAHFDLRESYGGLKITHATVMRRISQDLPVYFYGQRVASSEELLYLRNKDDLHIGVDDIKDREVYISVDLDVLDPAVCPAVGNPEPGGMKFEELLKVLKSVFHNNKVVGFDVVELQPLNNPFYGVYTAAELLKKMIIMKQGG